MKKTSSMLNQLSLYSTEDVPAGGSRARSRRHESRERLFLEEERARLAALCKSLELDKERIERIALSRGEFFASMSHEIRTPINSILGIAALMLDDDLSPDQRSNVQTIRSAAEYLLNLVNDILDYSKMEAGKTSLVEEPFNPLMLARSLLDLLAPHFKAKGVRYSLEATTELPEMLMGDPTRIGQVLVNLLGNAAKFTPHGGSVRMVLGADRLQNGAWELSVAVSDTGRGIPEDKLESIFESFTQVDHPIKGVPPGTGLGLAIAKKVVTLLGGRIGVDSKLGEGSTFYFTAPFKAHRLTSPERIDNQDVPARAERGSISVLLAEDHPVNQKLAVMLLEKKGFRVTVANDGNEAVSRFAAGGFDLVLMDWQMPELSGIEAARRIREIERQRGGRRTPIVAMTAHASVDHRERCLEAGMDDYVSKPVRPERLFEIIGRTVSREPRVKRRRG